MKDAFLFGAATASHQVEGGTHNDWTKWENKNAERLAAAAKKQHLVAPWEPYLLAKPLHPLRKENYISGRACDHYSRFREDFDIAKSLAHTAHRFSIEWSRVEPEEGRFNTKEIDHYKEVVRALRERGMEPFVTLWHYTLPVWLAEKGGVQNKDFPRYLARYGGIMAAAFGEKVKFWVTVNEPQIYSSHAYLAGRYPPQKRNLFLAWRSLRQCVRAHRLTYRAIKAANPSAMIGTAENFTYFDAVTGIANNILKFIGERLWNTYLIHHARGSLDFIGINYYFRSRIHGWYGRNENIRVNDLGWEIFPEGIYHVLMALKKYNLPVYITENGIADARDAQRETFLREHLAWVRKALRDGADVRGYFHWSLLDNFEWDKGFWPCFGLVHVDYGTLKRTVRPSALAYKEIIETWDKA